jgi:hypothetical protein
VKRPRVILGIELVLAALFLLRAHDCGFVGERAAMGLTFLFGQYGTTLIAVGLAAAGVAVGVPRKAWTALAGGISAAARRLRRARPGRSTSIGGRKTTSKSDDDSPTTTGEPPTPPVLAEVRSCLRQLGYTGAEIETVIPRLDTRAGLDAMVRHALQLLQKTP